MTLVIVILVLLLTLAFFYLKCSIMESFLTLGSTVLATIITFSYYELAGNFLISRGYGVDWALCGTFTIIFIVAFAILRSLSELLIAAPIDLGNPIKVSVALVCGLFTGILLSGNLLVVLGLLPMHGAIFYSRYAPDRPVVLSSPKAPVLGTDGFVTGLYHHISSGAMSSESKFGVLHADYLSQIHLNKLKTKDKILTVCSPQALVLPETNGKPKNSVRRTTFDDTTITLVRMGIHAKKIKSGGANNADGKIEFFPAQIRLITQKDGDAGVPSVKYPLGLWESGAVKKWTLEEIISLDPKRTKDKLLWMDVAFECSPSETPVLLQFKQNAVVELPPAVDLTQDGEQALDSEEEEAP